MKGHVYCILFKNGIGKFGMTTNPGSRLPPQIHTATGVGVDLHRVYLSTEIDGVEDVERDLLAYMSGMFEKNKNEYFKNVTISDVLDCFTSFDVPIMQLDNIRRVNFNKTSTFSAVFSNPDCEADDGDQVAGESLEDKIRKLSIDGITEGVIKYRVRGYAHKDVMECMDAMVSRGEMTVEEVKHPRRKTIARKFTLITP